MTTNALVAPPTESSALAGTLLIESVNDLATALDNEDWLAAGLAGVGTALDTVAAVSDPLGTLIGAGLGWVMEHLEPLKGWLNDLTGDANAVAGFAATWDNIAAQLDTSAADLEHFTQTDLELMSGAGLAAYTLYARDMTAHLRGLSGSSASVGSSLRTCGMIVQIVHDLVRDTLAELAGAIISWAAEIALTVGLATPWVVEQIATRVASLTTRVGRSVLDVTTSAKALKELVLALKKAIDDLATNLRTGKPKSPSEGRVGTSTTPGHGLAVGDGSRRELYDQMIDPHIHPHNADIVGDDYDFLGGGENREEFIDEFWGDVDPKTRDVDWRWPPHAGAVPGSQVVRPITPADTMTIDRIGGNGGSYFSPLDTDFSQRSLPPDRLNFDRNSYSIDTSHPLVVQQDLRIESSDIAPWFGQPGGGIQYRFVNAMGEEVPAWVLIDSRVLI